MTLPTDSNTLVLLHGFCLSPEIWQPLLNKLPENVHVITPNLHAVKHDSISQMADAVMEEMDQHGVSKAILVGHSMGGYVALEVLNMMPERVSGIILAHSTALADTPERREKRDQISAFIREHGSATFLDNFLPSLFHQPDAFSTEIEQLKQKASNISDHVIIAATMAMKNRNDHVETLRNTSVPAMYLCGKHDGFVSPEVNGEEVRRLKYARLVVSERAAHMGMLEDAQWLSVQITQFIAR